MRRRRSAWRICFRLRPPTLLRRKTRSFMEMGSRYLGLSALLPVWSSETLLCVNTLERIFSVKAAARRRTFLDAGGGGELSRDGSKGRITPGCVVLKGSCSSFSYCFWRDCFSSSKVSTGRIGDCAYSHPIARGISTSGR